MKKIVFLVVVLFGISHVIAQRQPKIKGNRNVTLVTDNLEPFNSVVVDDDIEVVLRKGDVESVEIEADDNLIDVLKFKVSDRVLYVSSFYKITSKKKLDITIYYLDLNSIAMSDGVLTMSDVITATEFDVNTTGRARIILNATADVMNIQMEGNSSGDFNVASDSLRLTFKDRVDAKVYATGLRNDLFMYKNASVKIEGSTDAFTAKMYGNSTLKSEEFDAKNVVLTSEDGADARVYARQSFNLSAKGNSKTSLFGDAAITITEFLDTTQLQKEKSK